MRRADAWILCCLSCASAPAAGADPASSGPSAGTASRAAALLGGAPSFGSPMTFARPVPKTRPYDTSEGAHWRDEVFASLEIKARRMLTHARAATGKKVAICFRVSPDGRSYDPRVCRLSESAALDRFALRVPAAAGPYPPPPVGAGREMIWVHTFGEAPVNP